MWYRLKLWFSDPAKNLWVHPTIGALFAMAFSLMAVIGNRYIPQGVVPAITAETLSSLLDIIASSMLAVTIFSLSIMVSAFAAASSGATPRAYKLMIGDNNTRTAITSFISAFIYSIIAKVALSLQYYGEQGRFVLFISTLIVFAYLIITLIRWIQTLSQLGTLGNTINKIEASATQALAAYRARPNFGAVHALPDSAPVLRITSPLTGYLTHIDFACLQRLAEACDAHFHVCEYSGKFVDPGTVLLSVHQASLDAERIDSLRAQVLNCFVLEHNRSYSNDPRFGLLVMSEVAQKAMSAAINDPATAITTINALTRILVDTEACSDVETPEYPNLSIEQFKASEFIKPVFAPIARDSQGNMEINMRLLKCLAIIAKHVPEAAIRQAAEQEARELIARATKHFSFAADQQQLREVYAEQFPEWDMGQ